MYEFLPDFYYTCGIIGHIDKVCNKQLKEGEEQQFSKKLRFMLEKKGERRVVLRGQEEGGLLHLGDQAKAGVEAIRESLARSFLLDDPAVMIHRGRGRKAIRIRIRRGWITLMEKR